MHTAHSFSASSSSLRSLRPLRLCGSFGFPSCDVFAEAGIVYAAPFISLDEPRLVPKQTFEGLREVIPSLTYEETVTAVEAGYAALREFNARLRRKFDGAQAGPGLRRPQAGPGRSRRGAPG